MKECKISISKVLYNLFLPVKARLFFFFRNIYNII